MDGNNHQIDRITAEATAREAPVAIIVDFVHVLEYLWKAAWCFHAEGDPAAELWVRRHAQQILAGHAMDLTGARWGLHGAEAILKLRALRSNHDFDAYWRYHLQQERQRVHQSRYASNVIPRPPDQ